MTSYPSLRDSPYLIGFMLAALMVWSLSAITRGMDSALQPTQVGLRDPRLGLGTAIQDSAITLKQRLRPTPHVTSVPAEPFRGRSEVVRVNPSFREITPPLVAAISHVTAPHITALTGFMRSDPSVQSSGDSKKQELKLKKKDVSLSSSRSSDVRGSSGSEGGQSSSSNSKRPGDNDRGHRHRAGK